jgi:hypothetical protein
VTKDSVQHADQLTNPCAATRCRRKAFEHVNDDWCRTMHRLLNVFGTKGPIVTGDSSAAISGRVVTGRRAANRFEPLPGQNTESQPDAPG